MFVKPCLTRTPCALLLPRHIPEWGLPGRPRRWRSRLVRTAAVPGAGSALLRFSPIKGFQTSPFDSRLCSGWEKFSPRGILPGAGGEGLFWTLRNKSEDAGSAG